MTRCGQRPGENVDMGSTKKNYELRDMQKIGKIWDYEQVEC